MGSPENAWMSKDSCTPRSRTCHLHTNSALRSCRPSAAMLGPGQKATAPSQKWHHTGPPGELLRYLRSRRPLVHRERTASTQRCGVESRSSYPARGVRSATVKASQRQTFASRSPAAGVSSQLGTDNIIFINLAYWGDRTRRPNFQCRLVGV